jgi:ABC-type nickel/cobalt efflux system permease component RcnA
MVVLAVVAATLAAAVAVVLVVWVMVAWADRRLLRRDLEAQSALERESAAAVASRSLYRLSSGLEALAAEIARLSALMPNCAGGTKSADERREGEHHERQHTRGRRDVG